MSRFDDILSRVRAAFFAESPDWNEHRLAIALHPDEGERDLLSKYLRSKGIKPDLKDDALWRLYNERPLHIGKRYSEMNIFTQRLFLCAVASRVAIRLFDTLIRFLPNNSFRLEFKDTLPPQGSLLVVFSVLQRSLAFLKSGTRLSLDLETFESYTSEQYYLIADKRDLLFQELNLLTQDVDKYALSLDAQQLLIEMYVWELISKTVEIILQFMKLIMDSDGFFIFFVPRSVVEMCRNVAQSAGIVGYLEKVPVSFVLAYQKNDRSAVLSRMPEFDWMLEHATYLIESSDSDKNDLISAMIERNQKLVDLYRKAFASY